MVTFDLSSKSRLTRHDLDRFPTGNLFDRVGRLPILASRWLVRRQRSRAKRG